METVVIRVRSGLQLTRYAEGNLRVSILAEKFAIGGCLVRSGSMVLYLWK